MLPSSCPVGVSSPARWMSSALCLITFLCLSACEGWPPNANSLKARFLENRSAYEEMRARMLAADYRRAALYGRGDVLYVSATRTVVVDAEQNTYSLEYEDLEDPEWVSLMTQAEVLAIDRYGPVVEFEPMPPFAGRLAHVFRRRKSDTSVRYSHYVDESRGYPTCEREYKELRCGRCVVPIIDEWVLHYGWSPDDLAAEASRKYIEDEISFAEHEELLDEAYAQCFIEGARAMGYEAEEDR